MCKRRGRWWCGPHWRAGSCIVKPHGVWVYVPGMVLVCCSFWTPKLCFVIMRWTVQHSATIARTNASDRTPADRHRVHRDNELAAWRLSHTSFPCTVYFMLDYRGSCLYIEKHLLRWSYPWMCFSFFKEVWSRHGTSCVFQKIKRYPQDLIRHAGLVTVIQCLVLSLPLERARKSNALPHGLFLVESTEMSKTVFL